MCFQTLLWQAKIFLALQRRARNNREGKILPSCSVSLHDKVLKGNFSFFLSVRTSRSPGERKAVSTPSQTPWSNSPVSEIQRGLAVAAGGNLSAELDGSGAWIGAVRWPARQNPPAQPDTALPAVSITPGGKRGLSAARRGTWGLHLPPVTRILRLGQGWEPGYWW